MVVLAGWGVRVAAMAMALLARVGARAAEEVADVAVAEVTGAALRAVMMADAWEATRAATRVVGMSVAEVREEELMGVEPKVVVASVGGTVEDDLVVVLMAEARMEGD